MRASERSRAKYPLATIAAYGPDNRRATKLVVGILRRAAHRLPPEEGIDYPMGRACPQCPFWADIDRFTHEPIPAPIATMAPDQVLIELGKDRTRSRWKHSIRPTHNVVPWCSRFWRFWNAASQIPRSDALENSSLIADRHAEMRLGSRHPAGRL